MPPAAKALVNTPLFDRLPPKSKQPLQKWIGRPLKRGFDIWWHQFGGQPWLIQGPERIVCPNPDCSLSRRNWAMKILATVHNEPLAGLPMIETKKQVKKNKGHFNHWLQMVFHVCVGCWTIHAGNRCD
jgi:hypothetical protein